MTTPTRTPISTEARRRVRIFRQRHTESANLIKSMLEYRAMQDDVAAWWMKKGVGRQRAEARIKKRLPGVRWHRTHHPVLLGVYLNPGPLPLIADPTDEGQMQTSVMVNYFMITEANMHIGPWTLEVPDHALGRIADRARSEDLRHVLFAAHSEALKIAMRSVPIEEEKSFLLATPSGAFLSEVGIGVYPNRTHDDDRECIIRPRTWLHEDQLHDNQKPVPHGCPSMGSTVLLPKPTRRLLRLPDTLRVRPNEYADRLDFFVAENGGEF